MWKKTFISLSLVKEKTSLDTHWKCTLGLAWQSWSMIQEAEQKELAGILPLLSLTHHNAYIYMEYNRTFQSKHKDIMLQINKIKIHRLKERRHRFPSLR